MPTALFAPIDNNKASTETMSKIVQRLALHPTRYDLGHEEHYLARGFVCPTCNGTGWRGGIAFNEERYPCKRCQGKGQLQARITVEWSSDKQSQPLFTNP